MSNRRTKTKTIPFSIGKRLKSRYNSVFAGTYLSYIPDKYSDNLALYQKNADAFFDEKDIDEWSRGNYINNAGDLTRFYFLNLAIDQLLHENIKGDVAELGVYKGNSAFILAKFARKSNSSLFLFDTFEGFDDKDLSGLDEHVSNTVFADTSLDYVKGIIGTENVNYVKGYFPDSLSQIQNAAQLRFSLVHIDCDLELPFKHSLEFFYPLLVSGGFFVLHDYSSLYWQGARKAIDAFFKDKKEKLIPIPDKSGTVVIRKL